MSSDLKAVGPDSSDQYAVVILGTLQECTWQGIGHQYPVWDVLTAQRTENGHPQFQWKAYLPHECVVLQQIDHFAVGAPQIGTF